MSPEMIIANPLKDYLNRQHDRISLTCGFYHMFEHGTYWCSNTAKEWANHQTRQDDDITKNWLRNDNEKISKNWPGWSQFMFVRDKILRSLLGTTQGDMYPFDDHYVNKVGTTVPDVIVIGEHTSKSIVLPVMQFEWMDMLVTARYNFHDWKVSVSLPEPVRNEDLMDIVETDSHLLNPVYFEGFPECYVYSPISANDYELTAQFSTMFSDNHNMYTFFWLLKKWYDKRITHHTTSLKVD